MSASLLPSPDLGRDSLETGHTDAGRLAPGGLKSGGSWMHLGTRESSGSLPIWLASNAIVLAQAERTSPHRAAANHAGHAHKAARLNNAVWGIGCGFCASLAWLTGGRVLASGFSMWGPEASRRRAALTGASTAARYIHPAERLHKAQGIDRGWQEG